MRVAINLLTKNPEHPSGAHCFWTRVIPGIAKRLDRREQLLLLVSPKSQYLYQGYGPDVHYVTYPWSNERRTPRTIPDEAASPGRDRLRDLGLKRAAEFTWRTTAASTLDVYRDVAENHRKRQK